MSGRANGRRTDTMRYLLPIMAVSSFASALSIRAMDPVLPQVAAELAVTIQVAATLASAFAITSRWCSLRSASSPIHLASRN